MYFELQQNFSDICGLQACQAQPSAQSNHACKVVSSKLCAEMLVSLLSGALYFIAAKQFCQGHPKEISSKITHKKKFEVPCYVHSISVLCIWISSGKYVHSCCPSTNLTNFDGCILSRLPSLTTLAQPGLTSTLVHTQWCMDHPA